MTTSTDLDRLVASWLADAGPADLPVGALDLAFARARRRSQRHGLAAWVAGARPWPAARRRWLPLLLPWPGAFTPARRRLATVFAVTLLVVLALAAALWIGSRPAAVPPGRLAIVSGGDVTIAMADGSRSQVIVDDPGVTFTGVTWLDDGSRIAVRGAGLTTVIDLRTAERRRIDVPDTEPGAWRPGGHDIAVIEAGSVDRHRGITLVDIDTGTRETIGTELIPDLVRWSADGSKLLETTADGLIVVDAASGQIIRTVRSAGLAQELRDPNLSSDGVLTAEGFTAGVSDIVTKTGTPDERRVLVATASDSGVGGSDWRPLTDPILEDPSTNDGPWAGLAPALSPDGRWVAYRANGRLELVSIDGASHRTLVEGQVGPFSWSADSSGLTLMLLADPSETTGSLAWVDIATATVRSLGIDRVTVFQQRKLEAIDASPDFPVTEHATSPTAVPSPSTVTASASEGLATAAPSPSATPEPLAGSHRLAFTIGGQRQCGKRLEVLDITTGHQTEPVKGCHTRIAIAPDGRHAFVNHLTDVLEPSDDGISTTGDPSTGTVTDLVDGSSSSIDLGDSDPTDPGAATTIGWSPGGRWMVRTTHVSQPFSARTEIARVGSSRWVRLPELLCAVPLESWCSGPMFVWSRDESRLLVRAAEHAPGDGPAGHRVYMIGKGDGTDLRPIPLTNVWSVTDDLARIAYGDRSGDAWTANIDGTGVTNLTKFEFGGVGDIRFSPDGRIIAVSQDRAIWLLDSSGQRRRIDLGRSPEGVSGAVSWSPDSRWLAVSIGQPTEAPGPGRTLLFAADGSLIARVNAAHVQWAPDGSHVAISVEPGDLERITTTAKHARAHGTTYLVAREGKVRRLKDAWGAAWSPDSTRFALRTGTGFPGGIDVVNADGTDRRAVTSRPLDGVLELHWVPDGS